MSTTLVDDTTTSSQTSAPTEARPLRVCHVSLTLKTGGLERLLADIARHHNATGCRPEFLAISEVGRFADIIRDAGCQVHVLKPTGRIGQLRQMAKLFRDGRFDVIHTHNTYPHIYGSIAARLAGVPVVVNTRHGQRAGHGWKSRTQFRWASHLVNKIIAVSDDAASLCIHADGVTERKVVRIWNGIDTDDFQFRGPSQSLTAVSVARLSAEKDFPTLLHAMKIAVTQVPQLKLKLAGDGPEREKLQQLTRELDLSNHVEFLGDCRDVPSLLSQAGFFVTSSLTEGISLTLLEAMAVGLPVIATEVGGNGEIVDDGRTGRLVPSADPQALAAAIVAMCQQPESWRQMGLAGRNRVEEYFDVRRMVSDYEQLYRNLLANRRFPVTG